MPITTNAVTTSLRAKEFATRMIHDYGKICGRRAVIPFSQAELARRYNLSASTLGWYLRELGQAVLERRPELILDLDSLAGESDLASRSNADWPAFQCKSMRQSRPSPNGDVLQEDESLEVMPLGIELLDVVGRLLTAATGPRPVTSRAAESRPPVAASADRPESSVGFCRSGAATAFLSFTFGACELYDGDYVTVVLFRAVGAAIGAKLTAGGGPILSNADHHSQILGRSICVGGSYTVKLGISGELCFRLNNHGVSLSNIWTLYGSVSLGVAGEAHILLSETVEVFSLNVPCVGGWNLPDLPWRLPDLPTVPSVGCG